MMMDHESALHAGDEQEDRCVSNTENGKGL